MAFEPKQHLCQLKGKDYLDCRWRVKWARDKHPDAQIDTDIVSRDLDKHEIVVQTSVTLPSTGARASSICMGSRKRRRA